MNTNMLYKVVVISLSVLLYCCCTAMENAGSVLAGNGPYYHPFFTSDTYTCVAMRIVEAYKNENNDEHRCMLKRMISTCKDIICNQPNRASNCFTDVSMLHSTLNLGFQSPITLHVVISATSMYKKAKRNIIEEACLTLRDYTRQPLDYDSVASMLYPNKQVMDYAHIKEIGRLAEEVQTLLASSSKVAGATQGMPMQSTVVH